MTLLLDTSLWIDFTRARSPAALKQFIAPLEAQFATLPTLPTPADLWQRAIALGQACRQNGRTVVSLNLLVAAVALHHNAVLVSFDVDFEAIASVSELRLQRLQRPA
jgi:predicted nucleic acid-binding protein